MSKASQLIVRTSVEQHNRLKAAAKSSGMSLNDLCRFRLDSRALGEELDPGLRAVLGLAEEAFGVELEGAVLFGSVARGDATDTSDLDLLLVLSSRVALDRDLYSAWDARCRGAATARVEVSFVHLPAATQTPTGFWAEIAIDGIVLVDRTLSVSRHLLRVRRDISTGRLIRRVTHGQAYWIVGEVA